jgi:hypothetical protein
MTIDKLEFHTDDAGTEAGAAAHMAIFLEWCADKGFLAASHDLEALRRDPIRYVVERSPNLAESDFTSAARGFVAAEYPEYLDYLGEHAADAGLSSYDYAATAEARATMFECLDEALDEARDEEE